MRCYYIWQFNRELITVSHWKMVNICEAIVTTAVALLEESFSPKSQGDNGK